MEKQTQMLREILDPGEEFTPIPFWFFNDAFQEDKVRKQLEDFAEKGVNGFVLHPRICPTCPRRILRRCAILWRRRIPCI